MKKPSWIPALLAMSVCLVLFGITGLCTTSVFQIALATLTPSMTLTPTLTKTHTLTPMPSNTPTFTPSMTFTITQTFTDTITLTPSLTFTPSLTDTLTLTPTRFVGFEMLEYSEVAYVGDFANAQILTKPGIVCRIDYYAPSGFHSKAEGLEEQTALEDGSCLWVWKIGTNTKPGTGRIAISANGANKSFPIIIME